MCGILSVMLLLCGFCDGMMGGVGGWRCGEVCKVNVQDIKTTYPVDELIRYIPDETAFGCATNYQAHLKLMEDLHWSSNQKVLPDLKDDAVGSSQIQKIIKVRLNPHRKCLCITHLPIIPWNMLVQINQGMHLLCTNLQEIPLTHIIYTTENL